LCGNPGGTVLTAPLGRSEIATLIPHAGAMCLLDAVRFWDATTIVCTASSHRAADNPMASGGSLDAVCGIEYAAQAMAVHGALTATECRRPAAGYLASVREVVCHTSRLDLLPDELEVTAKRVAGDNAAALYEFILRCGPATILLGRAAVVIDA
jgi:predicted hotdog family 3-hydroxylacyl-ACP dehydratase